MTISNAQAAFIGWGIEGVLYGLYVVLFGLAVMYLTWRRRKSSGHNRLMLFFACLLFCCCTAHFALQFDHLYRVLILHPVPLVDVTVETTELFGADSLVSITDFFGQMVLLYRCWIVWERNYYVVIFPAILALAGISCSMAVIGLLNVLDPNAPIAPASLVPLGTAGFAIPLGFNFVVTGLIVGRILWHGRRMRRVLFNSSHSSSNDAMAHIRSATNMLIESGALYLVVQIVFITLFAMNHPAQGVIVPIAVQIYGIAPTLIFVRVGLGLSSVVSETPISHSEFTTQSFRRVTPSGITVSKTWHSHNDFELSPVQDKVLCITKDDIESQNTAYRSSY